MKNDEKFTFQIPNYAKPEPKPVQAVSNTKEIQQENSKKSNYGTRAILEDLRKKGAEISQARSEAAEVLKRF